MAGAHFIICLFSERYPFIAEQKVLLIDITKVTARALQFNLHFAPMPFILTNKSQVYSP
jgi:hypothetical protein